MPFKRDPLEFLEQQIHWTKARIRRNWPGRNMQFETRGGTLVKATWRRSQLRNDIKVLRKRLKRREELENR